MLRNILRIIGLTALVAVICVPAGWAQNVARDYDDNDEYYRNADRARIDRYLDAEIWTNHTDNEFYEGDNIVVRFRVNRDAFIAIYSIDTRGRVNLLFPSGPEADNYVEGGVTYHIPGSFDDYDLVVTGPDGVENIQIVASRERFPIPDWYPNSGLIFDWDDRNDYMDFINSRYFVRYDGQRFAYDRTVIYINEWEDYYFRPVYYPHYPSWTVAGNVYVDWPIGGTVYVNGVYWGIAPLYIPRLYVGWHTFSVYDPFGYCWESDIHVHRYNTVILDRTIITPARGVSSKYKEVRYSGYRNPVTSGYPDYEKKVTRLAVTSKSKTAVSGTIAGSGKTKTKGSVITTTRKYARGEAKMVKTKRGYEVDAKPARPGSKDRYDSSGKTRVPTSSKVKRSQFEYKSNQGASRDRGYSSPGKQTKGKATLKESSKSKYYQKKSATTYKKQSKTGTSKGKASSGSSSGKSYKTQKSSNSAKGKQSSSSGKSVRQAPSQSSGSSKSAPKSAPKSSGSTSKGKKK